MTYTNNKSISFDHGIKESGLTEKELNILIGVSQEAARRGGEILMKHYGNLNMIRTKGYENDLLTNADLESEEEVLNYLSKSTPNISILAEESGLKGVEEALQWCVDPLDGTTNFAHGYPFFATSIGLTFRDLPILGSISIPFLKELYVAKPGKGAYCNDKRIMVSNCNKLSNSLLVTGFAYDRQNQIDNNYAEFCSLTHKTRGVRRGGAAAVDLAFIAKGRLDGYWERGLSKWDLAAGIAIVLAAGGYVSDYKNNQFNLASGRVIACTPGIKDELIRDLSKIKPLDGKDYGAPELSTISSL